MRSAALVVAGVVLALGVTGGLADDGRVTSVAVHHGTFALGDDGQDEPVQTLADELARQGVPADRFVALGFGETVSSTRRGGGQPGQGVAPRPCAGESR